MTETEQHPILTFGKLSQVLRKVLKDENAHIQHYSVKAGTEKGENYSSDMKQAHLVSANNEEFHWMVKLPPSDPSRIPMHRLLKIEEKEVLFYNEFAPKMRRLIEAKKAEVELPLVQSPHAEFHPEDEAEPSFVFMQNMKVCGYSDPPEKKKGLKPEYVKLAMEALAKFHAVSYAVFKSHPDGLDGGLKENDVIAKDFVFTEKDPKAGEMMAPYDKTMAMVSDAYMTACSNEKENIPRIIQNYMDKHGYADASEARNALIKADPDGFNVLCHGDTWFNNILFKHIDGKPVKAVWVDLSVMRWSNPANDIAYFAFLSVKREDRIKYMTEYLKHYHQHFVETLKRLDQDPDVYTFEQLLADYNKHSFVGFVFSTMILPGMLANKEDAIGPEDLAGDWSKPEDVEKIVARMKVKCMTIFRNQPLVKEVIYGGFQEMLERGIFQN